MSDEITLETTSAVSAFTGAPFVLMTWGTRSGQLTPDEARVLGLHIIGCADAAEGDAALVRTLRDIGLDQDASAAFLQSLRAMREAGS